MKLNQVFITLFGFCLALTYCQEELSIDNTGGSFTTTLTLLDNAETTSSAKALIDSVQEVYAQILQVRKDVNRSVSEIHEVQAHFNDINTTEMCNSCQDYISNLRLKGNTTDVFAELKKTLTDLCNNGSNNTVTCYYSVADFSEVLFDASLYQILDPVRFCQSFSYCPVTTVYETVQGYADQVLADKPANNIPTPTNSSNYKFLHLTDVHIDEFYLEGSNANCGSAGICCRPESGSPPNASDAAGFWGALADCDIPYRTFEEFLQYASENFEFDFIMWTGDNVAHDIYQQSIESQEAYTANTTKLIKQYFPNATVYPMFGNHEVYPMSQWDYINNSTAWMTEYFGQLWSDWLTQDAIASFVANGYYSEINTKHNLRIIAMNTEACDTYNLWLIADPTDPGHHLAWLQSELAAAEQANQTVFIMGHIPPGYSSCDSEWGARFRAINDRYVNIIRGQFYGHTHNDEFEVVRSYADDSAVGVAFIAPSFTTYPLLNPSYRVFEVDNETNFPINYYQYRLNLTAANIGPDQNLTWNLAYDANTEYGLDMLSWASLDAFIKNMHGNITLSKIYANNFYANGTDVSNLTLNQTHAFSCHAQYSVFLDTLNCQGQNATVDDLLYMAVQILPGGWYHEKS